MCLSPVVPQQGLEASVVSGCVRGGDGWGRECLASSALNAFIKTLMRTPSN